jgi:hypothetical protein
VANSGGSEYSAVMARPSICAPVGGRAGRGSTSILVGSAKFGVWVRLPVLC